jgi:hypothetical protein
MTAKGPPQEIFNPVVERLRAFTIEKAKPKKQWQLDYANVAAALNELTTAELLTELEKCRNKKTLTTEDKASLKLIPGMVQQRYISEMKEAIPDWQAWGGPTIIFDTETQNIEHGKQ